MDEDKIRIIPASEAPPTVRAEFDDEPASRRRPPLWVIAIAFVSTLGLLWVLSLDADPDSGEFRTVYSVPEFGANSFESIREFLPQPVYAHGYTWSLVALLDPEFGIIEPESEIEMVIGGMSGLVAVGRSNGGAAVWASDDGSGWSRASRIDDYSGIGYERWMSAVAVGGPGLVAVGGERGPRASPDENGSVWTSIDGSVWTRVPHDEAVFGNAALWMVASGGPGLVVIGDDLGKDTTGIWVSDDGVRWSRATVDESVFADATIVNMVAVGAGLVAVGYIGSEDDSAAAVWVSPDGTSWSSVPDVESTFGDTGPVAMFDVTVGGPGLIAVGGDANGAIVWTSEDGVTWRRARHDPEVFASELRYADVISGPMVSVAAGRHELLAVGPNPNNDALWASHDGVTWQRTHLGFDGLGGDRLISTGNGYVLLDDESVWQATPTDD